MAGYRQLAKRAICGYFGGTEQVAAEGGGIYYQGGPLSSAYYLGTAFPYQPKGVPDEFFFPAAGIGHGFIMNLQMPHTDLTVRQAVGGPTSGWRDITILTTCHLFALATDQYAEQTESAFDELIDAFLLLIYADRTLGTNGTYPAYPNSSLFVEAGEGRNGIRVGVDPLDIDEERGRVEGHATVVFDVTTWINA